MLAVASSVVTYLCTQCLAKYMSYKKHSNFHRIDEINYTIQAMGQKKNTYSLNAFQEMECHSLKLSTRIP